ncbi:MAG: LrgB family protein, partial [Muribaculaceae bacterium]|nr:LrgB family protein [Muribaculaceae bacterium]
MEFLENRFFLIALTFVCYLGAQWLQRRIGGISLMSPILLSICALIGFLTAADIDYATYREGGEFIEFWLKPAVVALGVPLYRQLEKIRRQMLPILLAELAGCVVGLISVVVLAELFGASREVAISLAPKAVTTPIAIEISESTGGIVPLTAAVVVCTGIFGSISGFKLVSLA